MPNMSLGGYTFETNPSSIEGVLVKDVPIAALQTWDSVCVFTWDPTYVGKSIPLQWKGMSTTMFAQLQTIREAAASVVFNPQDGTSKTFNVLVTGLVGTYHMNLSNASGHYRTDVTLTLLILSEV